MNSLKLGITSLFILSLAIIIPVTPVSAQENTDVVETVQTQLANVQKTIKDAFSGIHSGFEFVQNSISEDFELPIEPVYEVHSPQIRVGLYSQSAWGKLVITSEKDFKLENESGDVLTEISANSEVTVKYVPASKQYVITYDEQELTSDTLVRFVPVYAEAPFTLVNYWNPHPWYHGENDNMYRGVIEFRFNPTTWRTYVINELWLEDYVKGIGEANNTYDKEFYKVLAVVTRSYALHYTINEDKYPHLHFDVRPTTHDQLYRGYNYEKNVPVFQEAVFETRGQIVTYDGKPVKTPYFAQSAGRTYSNSVVWGGHLPWLKGTYDKYHGNYLAGHGVGMPLMGAVYLVKYDKLTYDDIIKHYYNNVDISPYVI